MNNTNNNDFFCSVSESNLFDNNKDLFNEKDIFNKRIFIEKYKPIFIGTLLYAAFTTFALYKNLSGITFPFFTMATLAYFIVALNLLEVKLKKDSWFYVVSIELFGISSCLTGDTKILLMNKLALIFLVIVFLLHQMYDDKQWNFSDYFRNILKQMFFPLENITRIFEDGGAYIKEKGSINNESSKKKKNTGKYIFAGVVIAVPLLIVVILMLATADKIFAKSIKAIFDFELIIENMGNVIGACIFFVFVLLTAYMQLTYLKEKRLGTNNWGMDKEKDNRACLEPTIGITVASILGFVYLMFSFIQIKYLFIGSVNGKILLPEGVTYSEYARSGFFQLLFVCILNIIIVMFGIYKFKESKVLKGLLTVITICTYVLTASSALRMILYIQYKYLTFLRVFVLLALLIIAFILAGVMICIYKKSFPFFKYSMVVVTVCYLLFSFTKPDYFIAKVNLDNMSQETQYDFFKNSPVYDDIDYLIDEIGVDGATAIINDKAIEQFKNYEGYTFKGYDSDYVDFKNEMFRCMYMENLQKELAGVKMGVRSWNLSRYNAIELLERTK